MSQLGSAHGATAMVRDRVCPASLVPSARKRALYARDVHFREGAEALAARLGGDWPVRCGALTMVLLRAESIVGRRIEPAIALLEDHGFTPVGVARIAPSRHVVRALKRYRLNAATLELLHVLDLQNEAAPSLLVLLRDVEAPADAPDAASRLCALKGPAKPYRRTAGQLRHRLGAVNEILTWVHTPDDASDLVRELGILCDARERRRLLDDASAAAVRAELREHVAALYAEHASEELDVAAALVRLRRALGARTTRRVPGHGRAMAILEALGEGEPDWQLRRAQGDECRWQEPLAVAERAGVPLRRWDRLLIASQYVAHTLPDVRAIV